MNIPDEVFEQAMEHGEGNNSDYRFIAEWARKEALQEAAGIVKSEIERLELVKGTYAKGQRHVLGLIWARLRSDALAEGEQA